MCQISKGLCKPFIIFLDIKSCSIIMICQGLKLLLGFSFFIGQVIFFLIMAAEIPVELVTIIGTAVLLNNIGAMTFSNNLLDVQLVE